MLSQEQTVAFQHLSQLISLDSTSKFDGKTIEINSVTNKEYTEIQINLLGLEFETITNNKIEVNLLAQDNTFKTVYFDAQDFIKRGLSISDFDNVDVVILTYESSILLKSSNEKYSKDKSLVFNYHSYHKLLNFILNNQDFVSYKSDSDREFVLLSSGAEKGVMRIGYNPLDSRVSSFNDFRGSISQLEQSFASKEYQIIFKEAIFQTIDQFEIKDRFFNIVQSLAVLISVSDLNYEIHVKKFSFESIKAKFKVERNKYFESLEKSLDGITKQITSIPLTYSATAFAGYQVKDKPIILLFIFLASTLYTFLAWKVSNVAFGNLIQVGNDIDKEKKEIQGISQTIAAQFETEFQTLTKKISKVKWLIYYFRIGLAAFLVMLLAFVYYQISTNSKSQPTRIELTKV